MHSVDRMLRQKDKQMEHRVTPTTTDALAEVLNIAWTGRFTTKSDNARNYADTIPAALERGLITTRVGAAVYGRDYLITPKGLTVLWAIQGIEG